MVEAGIDLVTVKDILGHSTIEMTIRYAHPTPKNKRRAVEKLEEMLNKSRHKIDSQEKTESDAVQINHLDTYN